MAVKYKLFKLADVCRAVSSRNDLIKGKQIQVFQDGLYSAFSATGQDIWRDVFEHEGDAIIVSAVGARCGKCFRASGKWTAIANTHIIFPNNNINRDYLYYYINDEEFWERGGLAQPFIKVKDTLRRKTVPIPVDDEGNPQIKEQERIASLLKGAEDLKQKRAQVEHKMSTLIPSLFDKIEVHSKFEELTIGELIERNWLLMHKDGNHGGMYPRSSDFKDNGVAFLSAASVLKSGVIEPLMVKKLVEEKAMQLKHGWIESGDVLLAHNATVGRVGYYNGEYDRAIIGTSLTAFRVDKDKINPRYLWAALRSEYFQNQLFRVMEQGLRNQVPITAQRKLKLRVPSLTIQNQLVSAIDEVVKIENKQLQSTKKINSLFQSILSIVFTN